MVNSILNSISEDEEEGKKGTKEQTTRPMSEEAKIEKLYSKARVGDSTVFLLEWSLLSPSEKNVYVEPQVAIGNISKTEQRRRRVRECHNRD